jgi:uncharacterized membrane-anchored protein
MIDILSGLIAIHWFFCFDHKIKVGQKMTDAKTNGKATFIAKLEREHVKHVGEKWVRRESFLIGIIFILFGILTFLF